MTIKQTLKKGFAFVFSFLTDKPVIISQGFTTTDDSLPEKKFPIRRPGLVHYQVRGDCDYVLMGTYRVAGRNVIRLLPTDNTKMIEIDEDLFKKLFKLI